MISFLFLQWKQAKNREVVAHLNNQQHVANVVTQSKPPEGPLKLNGDTASFLAYNTSSWAFVVRDAGGCFKGAQSFKAARTCDLKLAELLRSRQR